MRPDILRGIPQRVETFTRNHPLKAPTKVEMLALGAEAIWVAGYAGVIVYNRVTGELPPAFDLWLGVGIVGNGMYLINRGIKRTERFLEGRLKRNSP